MAKLHKCLKLLSNGSAISNPLLQNEPVKMDSKGQLHRYLYVDGEYMGTSELKMNYNLLASESWYEWTGFK